MILLVLLLWSGASAAPGLDPHEAMRQQPVPDGTCALCHAGAPTSEDPALRVPVERVCFSCHPDQRHLGVPTHLDRPLDPAAAARAVAASLPLIEGARIGCVTCHDPHPAPPERRENLVMPADWWTARFGTGTSRSDLARRPGGALCTVCHPVDQLAAQRP